MRRNIGLRLIPIALLLVLGGCSFTPEQRAQLVAEVSRTAAAVASEQAAKAAEKVAAEVAAKLGLTPEATRELIEKAKVEAAAAASAAAAKAAEEIAKKTIPEGSGNKVGAVLASILSILLNVGLTALTKGAVKA